MATIRLRLAINLLAVVSLAFSSSQAWAAEPRNILPPGYTLEAAAPVSGATFAAALRAESTNTTDYFSCSIGTSGEDEWTAWRPDWDPASSGWLAVDDGPTTFMTASPDGQWLCYDFWAELPADIPLNFEHMRRAELVMLSKPDGSGARPIGVTIQVGGGPRFDFTSDGSWVVGQPFLACRPTPESYARYLNNDWDDPEVEEFNYYDLSTGEYGWQEEISIGDGYWKCPYSDNFRIENNWYAEHQFSNFKTGGLLGEWATPDGNDAYISGWVLPDAVLLVRQEQVGLLYVDGTYLPAPSAGWEVYCWLPDGTFIFSNDGGASVKYGKVDWTTFSIDWHVDRPDLVDYLYYTMLPLRDSGGALLWQWGGDELIYTAVSREGSRP